MPSITGGPLGDKVFVFKGVRVKFGLTDNSGTEHALNGQKYAVEAQFSFYTAAGEAAYFSVLYKSDPAGINVPVQALNGIIQDGSSYVQAPFPLSVGDSIPANGSLYAYYSGSDSQEPCTPNVHWFIYLQVQKITPTTVSFALIFFDRLEL